MKCIILGSAEIKNYEKISGFINSNDFIIACDGGLNHVEKLGLSPLTINLIVGDFDSHQRPVKSDYPNAEIIQLPCEKDDTDVFFAIKEALRREFKSFILIGVIGQRFDHSLCNISVLYYLKNQGANAKILDDYSEMELIDKSVGKVLVPETYSYFSLMCVDGNAKGVTIKNAKYPLENAEITTEYQYAISNEVIPGLSAEISVLEGSLLLIKVF